MSGMIQAAGAVAGLAGVALVVYLTLNREIIRKKIFPMLTKKQAYRILVLLIVCISIVTIFGIIAAVAPGIIERMFFPKVGWALISSEPEDARINFKDGLLGTTPQKIQLPFGENKIVLRKSGYYDETLTVPISNRSIVYDLGSVRLRERIVGWIRIESAIPNVTVRLGNATFKDISTPATFGQYEEGLYLLQVTKPHEEYNTYYYLWQDTVRVVRRGTTHVTFNPGTWQLHETASN
jgi:hypothetical protein